MRHDTHDDTPEYVELVNRWGSALALTAEALEDLRWIYPERMLMLTEAGHTPIRAAMQAAQDALVQLHRAGPHVVGLEQYDALVADRAASPVGGGVPRLRAQMPGLETEAARVDA